MAVTINEPVKIYEMIGFYVVWEVTYSSDVQDPTFYIYQDGELLATTQLTMWRFTVAAGKSLMIEILDDATVAAGEVFPPTLTLGWHRVADANQYVIEEYVASVWTERARVDEVGSGYYMWSSRVLEDVTTHQFRVTPEDDNGISGTPIEFTALMARNPDRPSRVITYDDQTGKVTVAAA